jgi:hypothetical protein
MDLIDLIFLGRVNGTRNSGTRPTSLASKTFIRSGFKYSKDIDLLLYSYVLNAQASLHAFIDRLDKLLGCMQSPACTKCGRTP